MTSNFQFSNPQINPLRDAALDYARRGWPVFHCWGTEVDGTCACRDPQCKAIGKHPVSRGVTGATLDAKTIVDWWLSFPRSNVAVRTGAGLVVVDLDVKPGLDGVRSWRELEAIHGETVATVTATTGSGGKHLYFRTTEEVSNYQGGKRLGAGIDVRGHHGFVIAPPSRHRSGKEYRWDEGRSPAEVAVADCPRWLLDLMLAQPESPRHVETPPSVSPTPAARSYRSVTDQHLPTTITQGARNSELFSLAGTLRRVGLTAAQIRQVVSVVNFSRCRPPLTNVEVITIAKGVQRYDVPQRSDSRSGARSQRIVAIQWAVRLAGALVRRGLTIEEVASALWSIHGPGREHELAVKDLSIITTDAFVRAMGAQ